MSMKAKLDQAHAMGVLNERARILWIMDDMRTDLRQGLEKVILVEAQRHAMQVKVKLAISIFETLKMRMMSGDKPPGGGRPTKENGDGQEEEPHDQGS